MEFKYIGLNNKLNYRDLIILVIPIILFSIYLSVFNPGIATIDSFNQLHQIASNHFTNWHPFFHTFITMLCLKVYPSIISICIFQIFVFSIIWMIICKYNRDDNIQTKNPFILQVILTLIICLIPINGLYSITLWKDILFSYFLMFLCFLVKVLIDKEGRVNFKFIILFSLIMAFIFQLRGNGMYVILISIAIYSIYLFIKKNIKMSIVLPILTITFILLISSLNIVYDVEDNDYDPLMTKTAHMLVDYDLNLEIEKTDSDKIHKLIDKDNISEVYEPTFLDPIRYSINQNEVENHREEYIGLAIKYSLKDPIYFLQYLFKSSPIVWDITRNTDWYGEPYYLLWKEDCLQLSSETFFKKVNSTPIEDYENISFVNWGTPIFKIFNFVSIGFEYHNVADTLFNSPSLYMYLSIIILILIEFITKSKKIYLMYIPNLLNIIIVFLSTPVQDNRYLYANLLVCYLLIIILMELRQSFPNKH